MKAFYPFLFLVFYFVSSSNEFKPLAIKGLSDEVKLFEREKDKAILALIPEGDFFFGYDSPLAPPYEQPLIEAKEKAFFIDRFEVSAVQYLGCIRDGKCPSPAQEATSKNDPVRGIDWSAARAYCQWVGGELPTEAQWEYAVRGKSSTLYPWGNKAVDDGVEYGTLSYLKESSPVSERSELPTSYASSFGVENLHDSVSEWVLDAVDLDKDGQIIPRKYDEPRLKYWSYTSDASEYRVVKGANYKIRFPHLQRASYREARQKDTKSPLIGFRCVHPKP